MFLENNYILLRTIANTIKIEKKEELNLNFF